MSQKARKQTAPLAESLTPREQEVLTLVGKQRTNRQIADELVIAYSTVRWYLRQISNKLGVSGRDAVVERAQALGLIAKPISLAEQKTNLPAPQTPFVGREAELQVLGEWVLDPHTRLVTIVGPGGIGKTRVALALSERQVARRAPGSDSSLFPDGVWYVSLASVQAAAEVVPAMTAALGLEVERGDGHGRGLKKQLLDFLRPSKLLLFLDNLEHLLSALPLLAELLAVAPQVKLLVASRRRLQMRGERVFLLNGLELPAENSVRDVATYPAVRLFMDTAQRVQPELTPDQDALAAVARVCRLLEGTPLAIELAASWASLLPPRAIEREVQRGLDILATELADVPPRHQSMQATLDLSWARLEPPEQQAFMGLSIFRGGFTRDAAREVAGATLQSLKKLVDASWLTYSQEDNRCQVQELLRQYGAARLRTDQDLETEVRDRHARYYTAFLQMHDDLWYGPRQPQGLDEVQREIDNIRAAWRWAAGQGRVDLMWQALRSLHVYYDFRGHFGEAQRLLRAASESLLVTVDGTDDEIARRRLLARMLVSRALFGGTVGERRVMLDQAETLVEGLRHERIDVRRTELLLSYVRGRIEALRDPAAARPYFERFRALSDELNDPAGIAYATSFLSVMACTEGDEQATAELVEQAVEGHRALSNDSGVARVMRVVGEMARKQGHLEKAVEAHRHAYEVRRFDQPDVCTARGAAQLATTLVWRGEFAEARALAQENMKIALRSGSSRLIASLETALALALLHGRCYDEARSYAAQALARARELGDRRGEGWSLCCIAQYHQVSAVYGKAIDAAGEAAGVLSAYREGIWPVPLVYQAYALASKGAHGQARERLLEAIDQTPPALRFFVLVNALPLAAQLLTAQGCGQQALEVYALACGYPYVANSHWFADLFANEMAALVSARATEDVAAAVVRGRARELKETAEELIEAFGGAAD